MRNPPSPTRSVCFAMAIGITLTLGQAMATPATFSPPLGDKYREWVLRSMSALSPGDLASIYPFQPDGAWVEEYLQAPSSIYSELHPRLFTWNMQDDDSMPGIPMATSRTAKAIAWDLGLTKAIPGRGGQLDHPHFDVMEYNAQVRVNLGKAGVLARYFQKAYELGGNDLYTLNAEMAVAVQILHEWVEATPSEERLELGVYEDVLQRFESATLLSDIPDADLGYLADILRSELSTWHAGSANVYGVRELRTPLRIARVAAAYEGTQPTLRVCDDALVHIPGRASLVPEDTSGEICGTDATDRAVYRRYRALRAHQIGATAGSFSNMERAGRLVDAFADIKPAWAGAFNAKALDWSNHAEVLEVQIAVEGDPQRDTDMDFYRLVERANMLVCRSAAQ